MSQTSFAKTVHRALAGFLLAGGLLTFVACSSDSDGSAGDERCTGGKACVCDGDCSLTCESESGGGCDFVCKAGSSCTFDCPGGGCQITCSDAASCTSHCKGNGCQQTCGAGTATCVVDECTATCQLTCGGAASCDLSCDPTNGGCVKS